MKLSEVSFGVVKCGDKYYHRNLDPWIGDNPVTCNVTDLQSGKQEYLNPETDIENITKLEDVSYLEITKKVIKILEERSIDLNYSYDGFWLTKSYPSEFINKKEMKLIYKGNVYKACSNYLNHLKKIGLDETEISEIVTSIYCNQRRILKYDFPEDLKVIFTLWNLIGCMEETGIYDDYH